MDRQWKFKGLLAVGLLIVSVLMLVPTLVGPTPKGEDPRLPGWFTGIFANRLILGLDLQGGIHLQYQVDVPDALRRRAIQTAGNLESLLKSERNIEVKATPGEGDSLDEITTVAVVFPAAEDTAKLDVEFVGKNLPEYEIGDVDGTSVRLVMKADAIRSFQEDAVDKAIDTIERRINAFGVAESTISRRGEGELVTMSPIWPVLS